MSESVDKSQPPRVVPTWLVIVGSVLMLGFTMVLLSRVIFPQWWVAGATEPQAPANSAAANGSLTAEVIALTNVTSVQASGNVEPLQMAQVFFGTTGQVQGVHAVEGDFVTRDQVLLSLDPESVPQTIIQAQVELINAENLLKDLLQPTPLQVAQAQQAVVLAQQRLEQSETDVRNALNPAGQSLYDQVADAELALTQAETSLALTNNSSDAQQLAAAEAEVAAALSNVQRLRQQYEDGNRTTFLENAIRQAEAAYDAAVRRRTEVQLRLQQQTLGAEDSRNTAQEQLERALRNLNSALQGPDADKVLRAQAAMSVAEAELAEAEERLNEVLFGADPDDIAAAQARIMAAEKTLEAVVVQAPFDGELIEVAYRKGDLVSPQTPAVTVANTSVLLVKISVDESDVARLSIGQPARVTFDALPGVETTGVVSRIGAMGTNVQGIIRYPVEIALLERPAGLLLGMSADVEVVTEVEAGVLAVPLDAVQLVGNREFVTVVNSDGSTREVTVVTSTIQSDYVLVEEGDLQVGDQLALFEVRPSSTFNIFDN